MTSRAPSYTPVPPVVAAYLGELGFPAPLTLEDLPVAILLTVLFKADYESSYGVEDGWDSVSNPVNHAIPERVIDGVTYYCQATKASAADLLEEGEAAVRRAARRLPAGCFCSIMESPSGCLTCSCPDCGAAGRFGLPIIHRTGCA